MANRYSPKNTVRPYNRTNDNYRSHYGSEQRNNGPHAHRRMGSPPRDNLQYVRDLPVDLKHGLPMYKAVSKGVTNPLARSGGSWVRDIPHFAELDQCRYVVQPLTRMDSYLRSIESHYASEESKCNAKLQAQIDEFNSEWLGSHDAIPDAKDTKSELGSEYHGQIKKLKRSQMPMIYCGPKTGNFQYLRNSVELLSSRKTICFSFDIEAYEKDNNVVTEIGVSVYDPRENLHSLVPITRNFHLIVSESLSLRNRNWVCDMKECYLLGQSAVLPLAQCVEFVQALVNYYMVPGSEESKSWSRAYVGHNIDGDIKWLQDIGVRIPHAEKLNRNADLKGASPEVPFVLDTMKLYTCCYGQNGASLGKILRLMRLPHAFLHNAGNDAHYTLQLLLHMCDVNFRVQYGLDDIAKFQQRVQELLDRGKTEAKVVPMSYSVTIRDAGKARKPKKDLVPQTEFGGARWFPNPRSAFDSMVDDVGGF